MPIKKSPKSSPNHSGMLPKIVILAGIVLLVAVVFLVKNQPSKSDAPTNESPEVQLNWYMKEGKPIFAFFHSTNCNSCIVMMETVDQVYPEFKDRVALVDVNVYDPRNESLLQRAGISSIPTLVFINGKGEGKVSVGVIEADVLRQQLIALKEMP